MAIIPRGQESARVQASAPVQIASAGGELAEGAALQGVGESLRRFGNQQIDAGRSINTYEGKAQLDQAVKQSYLRAQQDSLADGSDFLDNYARYSQQETEKVVSQFSGFDPVVRQNLESYRSVLSGEVETTGLVTAARMREQYTYTELERSVYSAADRMRQTPDSKLFDAEVRSFGTMVDELVGKQFLSVENAKKVRGAFYEQASQQYINGLLLQGREEDALSFLTATQSDLDPNTVDSELQTEIDPMQARDLGFLTTKEAKVLEANGERYKVPMVRTVSGVQLTNGESLASSSMDPRTKSGLIEQIMRRKKEKDAVNLNDLSVEMNAAIDRLSRGEDVPSPLVAKVYDDLSKARQDGKITDQAFNRNYAQLELARVVGMRMKSAASTPRNQYQKLINATEKDADGLLKLGKLGDSIAVQEIRDKFMTTLPKQYGDLMREQEDDAAAYILKYQPEMQSLEKGTKSKDAAGNMFTQSYAEKMLAKQDYIGIRNKRILTKDQAKAIALDLKNTPDSLETSQKMADLEQKYGSKYFPKIMDELGQADKDVAALKIATFAGVSERSDLVDAIKNEDAIKQSFKTVFTDTEEASVKRVRASVASTIEPLRKVYALSSNNSQQLDTANNIQRAVELETMREMSKRSADISDGEIQDIAKASYQKLVGQHYSFPYYGRSFIMMPKKIDGVATSEELVTGFLEVYSQADGFKELGIKPPANYAQRPDDYYELLEQSAKWRPTNDGTGIVLEAFSPNVGGGGRFEPVRDAKGRPVVRSFKYINSSLDPEQFKKIEDAVTPFYKKIFKKGTEAVGDVFQGVVDRYNPNNFGGRNSSSSNFGGR